MSTLRIWRSIIELNILPARIERTTQGSEPCAFPLRYGRVFVVPIRTTRMPRRSKRCSLLLTYVTEFIQGMILDANVFLKCGFKTIEEEE